MDKKISPAVVEHVMEENERLREALREAAKTFDEIEGADGTDRNICEEAASRINAALSQQAEPAPEQDERGDELEAIHQYAFEVGGTEGGRYMLEPEELDEVARRACEPFEDVLRSLACSLGAGAYNALTVDPAVFEQKIRWGIDQLTRPAQTEQQPVAEVLWPDEPGRRGGFSQIGHYDDPRLPVGAKLYADPVVQTAPQPEQSGLVEALEATNLLLRTQRHACAITEVCRVLDSRIERNCAALAAHEESVKP